ncbi:hypothetical protein AZE42_03852 [Rhizopogon vesiculosus]|uniref:Uncharacterized protein n=1 Tax=Rhizopogon vesiculosus TaxID=180088 RepID=A0A1J8QT17_9AGAM|nr:hypothetical protein AZE42_03852 [Rhizopogon vesiculosus]
MDCSHFSWQFWSTSIVGAVIQIVGILFLQETYAPVLLERKAERIRRSVSVEDAPYRKVRTVFETQDRS